MDRSEVKNIVDEHIRFMIWDLQLQKWEIECSFDPEEDNIKASCKAEPAYMHALINIDPTKHNVEEDVLRSLRHELIHIFDSPYETYRKMVGQIISDEAFHALDEVFTMAKEQTRLMVEQMLDYGYKLPLSKRNVELKSSSPYKVDAS